MSSGARIIRRTSGPSITRTVFGVETIGVFDRSSRTPERTPGHLEYATCWLLGCLLCCQIAISGCGRFAATEPNVQRVVLITIDTLRADHVGCYGAARAHTPNLDAVAAGGVRFQSAVSPAPLTLPSHASLLTALEPPHHGIRHNSIYELPRQIPTLAERMQEAGFETVAVVGAAVLARRFGLDRGFASYDDAFSGGRLSGAVGYAERSADAVVDATLERLQGAADRFFVWLHFYDPHSEYKPPSGFASAFASDPYAGEIAYVDWQIGRLLAAIRDRWGDDGLLVAITSDHGESLGEHGEINHSYTIYEATQHVPLILRGPGIPEGRVVSELVRLIDVAPTLLALSGAPALGSTDGRDLAPLLAGREETPRSGYMETLATQFDHGWSPLFGIRSGRYKFIRAPRPELYDLVRDPTEIHNQFEAEPEIAAQLDGLLAEHVSTPGRTTAPHRTVPEAERRQLESLGYVVPGEPASGRLGVVGGPDPKDRIGILGVIASAHAALSEGRPADALELLEAHEDSGSVVAAMRAAAALTVGDFARAARDAREVLRVQPKRPDIEMILARALEAGGDVSGALEAYRRCVALDPTAAAAHRGVGRTLLALGDREAATAAFQRADDLAP